MKSRSPIIDFNAIEEVLRNFDSFFSVSQCAESVIPQLASIERPYEPQTCELRYLTIYVGSVWAQMVSAIELNFDLTKGDFLFHESEECGSTLLARFQSRETHPEDQTLLLHMLARWNDICAKLFYFCGDHDKAKNYWSIAAHLIERNEAIGFIRADVFSSRMRNENELTRFAVGNVKVDADAAKKFDEQFKVEIEAAKRQLSPEVVGLLGQNGSVQSGLEERVRELGARDRERLRGLANLYQNSSQFSMVRLIASAMKDDVRIMQSYHAEAGKIRHTEPLRAKHLWKQVRDSKAWKRGVFFARQQLAMLEADLDGYAVADCHYNQLRCRELLSQISQVTSFANLSELLTVTDDKSLLEQVNKWIALNKANYLNSASDEKERNRRLRVVEDLEELKTHLHEVNSKSPGKLPYLHLVTCIDELFQLIDDIQAHVRSTEKRGKAPVFDIALHGWTVRNATRYLDRLQEIAKSNDAVKEHFDRLNRRMLEELEQMVRSHRRVIRISTFKTEFAKYYDWAFKRLYGYHYQSQCAAELKNDEGGREFHLKRAVAWAEESTARDLLDILASRAKQVTPVSPQPRARQSNGFAKPLKTPNGFDSHGDAIRRSKRGDKGKTSQRIQETYDQFEKFARLHPIETQEVGIGLLDEIRREARRTKAYYVKFVETDGTLKSSLHAYVVDPSENCRVIEVDRTAIADLDVSLNAVFEVDIANATAFDFVRPLENLSKLLGSRLIQKIITDAEIPAGVTVFLVPTGALWRMPLHIAAVDGTNDGTLVPFGIRNTVIISGSLAALISHNRATLATRSIEGELSLAICASYSTKECDGALFGMDVYKHFRPQLSKLTSNIVRRQDTNDSIAYCADTGFFQEALNSSSDVLYIGCHGEFVTDDVGDHAYLMLYGLDKSHKNPEESILTPYDLATLEPMTNNTVTIMAACLSGQGAARGGGEVSGFYRGAVAAGAGACLFCYWPVSSKMADTFVAHFLTELSSGSNLTDSFQNARRIVNTSFVSELGESVCFGCCFGLFI